jgi:hypothetical protein
MGTREVRARSGGSGRRDVSTEPRIGAWPTEGLVAG